MLFAGSDDGVYRIADVREPGESPAEKVLDAEQMYRLYQSDAVDGLFGTAESGLYYSPDGSEWTPLALPEAKVYAVTAAPSGDRLYVGTRPARVFAAELDGGVPTDEGDWEEGPGFRELRERADWGIPRHDGVSQVRSLRTHSAAPDRIVAGVEVGGVHVSDDRGETWTRRCIDGFDAPHTDDIHHVALADAETLVASTGSGLYRSTDVGRTWERLDDDHRQRYFRGAFVRDGVVYAGGAPASSASWEEDADHALFESRDGERLDRVSSPTPEAVALGWCEADGDVLTATHRGRLLRRGADGWRAVGTVPTPGSVRGRYLPLSWGEP
ncbi:WD40/YVTN/BNR-like repeat-containing protein [Halorussus aquaticus]|uniref:WD40/YVTN/BNR-like repeat-containing protein n=1 Tax=Halorussus aquaticus TaxID=2953748 RepID=A0ABD5Q3P1_9EURY|nr:WD40 repeat domain-containing protein [Halorussus aquaticus]